MTWDQLLEETAQRARVCPADAAKVLNAFFDAVIQGMEAENTILLRPDFGYFEMRTAGGGKALQDQNLRKSPCRTPVFKKSGMLKKQLRRSDAEYPEMLGGAGRTAQAERLLQKQRSDHTA